jgi:hypothetical protein
MRGADSHERLEEMRDRFSHLGINIEDDTRARSALPAPPLNRAPPSMRSASGVELESAIGVDVRPGWWFAVTRCP